LIRGVAYSGELDNIFFVGQTKSPENFPLSFPSSLPDAFKQEELAGGQDGFIGRLSIPDIITSIKEIKSVSQQIFVYPNPANDVLQINFPSFSIGQSLRLYDSNGRLAAQKYIDNGIDSTEISIGNLASGVHCLHFGTDGVLFIKN